MWPRRARTACYSLPREDAFRPGSRADFVELHEPPSLVPDRPRPASRPRAEADCPELPERGLGGSAARWRRWRLPRAGLPVHGAGRTGLDLWRGRGGKVRGRSLGSREERRVFAEIGEAVDYAAVITREHFAGEDDCG